MKMRVLFTAAVSLLALAACGNPAPAAPTAEEIAKASADINAWFDAEYEEELQMSPIALTFQGRKDQYDKLDDFSEAAIDRDLEWRRASVAEMKEKFVPENLNEEARTSYDLWSLELEMTEKAAKFRRSPYIFVKDGPHTFLPQFVMQFHEVADNVRHGRLCLAYRRDRSGDGPDAGAGEAGGGRGQSRSRASPTRIQSIFSANVIAGAPFGPGADSPIWADVKSELKTLVYGGKLTADEAKAIETAAKMALIDKLKPAYERVIAWLKEDLPKTSEQATGASALKDGVAFYDNALAQQTTTTMTANEIHELGLSEVARIHGEMEKIKAQVGFTGTLVEFFDFMRTSPNFQLSKRRRRPRAVHQDVGRLSGRHDGQVAGVFRHPAQGKAGGEARRSVPRTAGRGPALLPGHAGRLAPGHLLCPPLRHEVDADLHARSDRLSRGRSGSPLADRHRAGADERSEVPHAIWLRPRIRKAGVSIRRMRWRKRCRAPTQDPYSDFRSPRL
jgi:hypothetical protein